MIPAGVGCASGSNTWVGHTCRQKPQVCPLHSMESRVIAKVFFMRHRHRGAFSSSDCCKRSFSLPRFWVIGRKLTAERPVLSIPEGVLSLNELLNLPASLVDHSAFRIAQETFDIIFVGIAICAVNLYRVGSRVE